jgi:hypothetical protein
MGGHAPASDDFIVILADAFAGKNALLPATAPLLAAARPMRAAVTPRPAPATARLAMDMQREADIVDVRCRWNGRRARSKRDQNPKTPPRDKKNEAPHALVGTEADSVSVPAERETNISAESRRVRSADHRRVNESPIPRLSRKTKTIRLALASNEKAFRALDAKLLLFAMAKP